MIYVSRDSRTKRVGSAEAIRTTSVYFPVRVHVGIVKVEDLPTPMLIGFQSVRGCGLQVQQVRSLLISQPIVTTGSLAYSAPFLPINYCVANSCAPLRIIMHE